MRYLKIRKIFVSIILLLERFLPNTKRMNYQRAHFYRLSGMNLSKGVHIAGTINVLIEEIPQVTVGARTYINQNVHFGAGSHVRVGEDCLIGPGCVIETSSHRLNEERTSFSLPIIIEDGVWLGAGSVVLGGVQIGAYAVVAAGAVVNRDVAAREVVGGVPVRRLNVSQSLPVGIGEQK